MSISVVSAVPFESFSLAEKPKTGGDTFSVAPPKSEVFAPGKQKQFIKRASELLHESSSLAVSRLACGKAFFWE